jgi:hypothetical protein
MPTPLDIVTANSATTAVRWFVRRVAAERVRECVECVAAGGVESYDTWLVLDCVF